MSVAAASGLLEREPFVERLREAFAQAEQNRRRVVLLSGEAGVGKTALVRHFCEVYHAPACSPEPASRSSLRGRWDRLAMSLRRPEASSRSSSNGLLGHTKCSGRCSRS